jgi:hypothetical protein
MSENIDPRSIARAHIEAMSRKDFQAMERNFAAAITFKGPGGSLSGVADVLGGYRRLGPILLRNDIHKIFVDGEDVCVIYDFVTDTAGGVVATVEWLRTQAGKIQSIWLLFDRGPWPAVMEELSRRTSR